jgi:type I restriction enzyme R subunit
MEDLQQTIKKNTRWGFKAKANTSSCSSTNATARRGGRLHDAMRANMGQDVMLIGFTGTPLLRDAKKNATVAFRNVSEVTEVR